MNKNFQGRTKLIQFMSVFVLLFLQLNNFAQSNSQVSISLYENPIKKTIDLIENSKVNIKAVVYKFELNSVYESLIEAHKRGVKIQILVDAKEAKKKKSLVKLAKKHGVKIRKWKTGKMHAKFTIIDEKKVITGSFNWTKTAKKENLELIIFHNDSTTVEGFVILFKDIWKKAKQDKVPNLN